MSDQVKAASGAPPWLPTSSTQPIETLSYYDGPWLGIFSQDGVPYLFRCLVGHLSSAQMWLYAPLTDREVDALQDVDGDRLDELVDQLSVSRPITIGLADDTGLLFTEVQEPYGIAPSDLPTEAFTRITVSLKRINERTEDLVKSL